jgi:acyl-CoA reductase-like NAD-dependent aldehyde dehydrogenase
MTIAQEEIFGPVLSIISYSGDEDEGVALVNGTDYGLCGAVWGPDDRSAYGVARRIRAGQVDINGAPYNGLAPFGGFGLSGHGRELGPLGIEEFLAPQALQFHDVPFMDFP